MFETNNNDMIYRTKQEILDAANYQAKRGRPKKLEASTIRSVRILNDTWDKLVEPKSDSVRNALNKFVSSIK
jgi:hypothetical protein